MNGFVYYPQPTYDGTTLTLAGGTVTTSSPPLTITQTWNDAAVVFTGVLLNITTTASHSASYLMNLQTGGSTRFLVTQGGSVQAAGLIYSSGGAGATIGADGVGNPFVGFGATTSLIRDAAYTLAQRYGTNVQAFHHYARHVSATDRNYLAIRHASTTLTNVTGATVTATNLIPAGAVVLGVSTRVTTALGTTNGTTGYQVGDGTDPDRWGAITGTAVATKSTNANWTAATIPIFTAANNVVITAVGGNFDATGVIYVDVSYAFGDAD